jgi:hypothetical protein
MAELVPADSDHAAVGAAIMELIQTGNSLFEASARRCWPELDDLLTKLEQGERLAALTPQPFKH